MTEPDLATEFVTDLDEIAHALHELRKRDRPAMPVWASLAGPELVIVGRRCILLGFVVYNFTGATQTFGFYDGPSANQVQVGSGSVAASQVATVWYGKPGLTVAQGLVLASTGNSLVGSVTAFVQD